MSAGVWEDRGLPTLLKTPPCHGEEGVAPPSRQGQQKNGKREDGVEGPVPSATGTLCCGCCCMGVMEAQVGRNASQSRVSVALGI